MYKNMNSLSQFSSMWK
uniref:Uncharacterized protein n=1 Tax=Arundo donax TaxID=35708 RepID=A0A0A9C9S1_ARUDO